MWNTQLSSISHQTHRSGGYINPMRETVAVQIGQCGNQIGNQFWSTLLKEHETTPDTDSSLSSYFRFEQQRNGPSVMKARALLIDMECGPLQETMRGPLASLFDETQFVMDVYGSGNNFAHGNRVYGPQYRASFEEGLRKNAELCDSLQTFVVTHSLGGGTGSGVGTYVLNLLEDMFPEVYRFAVSVFPSEDNDVITSPYNSVLATKELIDHAHCVLPIDNHALQSFARLEREQKAKASKKRTAYTTTSCDSDKGFEEMNGVAARMLCNLTSSSRFHGDMNVDMNEICTNLVPYPRLPFLMTALSPYRASSATASSMATGGGKSSSASVPKVTLQRAFGDLLSANGQISASVPCGDGRTTLASAFLVRGKVPLSDFLKCVRSSQRSLKFPSWNPDACKIGMCSTPHPGESFSALGVFNSTAFGTVLTRERSRFNQLFRRKAMLHHYTEFLEEEDVVLAHDTVSEVIDNYVSIDDGSWRCHKDFMDTRALTDKLFPDF